MLLKGDVFHCGLMITWLGVEFVPMTALTWFVGTVAVTTSVPLDITAPARTLVPMVCVTVFVTIVPLGGQLTQPVKVSAEAVSAADSADIASMGIFTMRFMVPFFYGYRKKWMVLVTDIPMPGFPSSGSL